MPRREKDDFERVSTEFEVHAFVPERSKGLDSSSSVFVLVGSSPTECILFSDSEVVITVDFESTIRSSNLRRRKLLYVGAYVKCSDSFFDSSEGLNGRFIYFNFPHLSVQPSGCDIKQTLKYTEKISMVSEQE